MFIDNKYTKIYNSIIAQSKIRDLNGYVEKHHIIPRSLGGTNLKENIAILTAREHFICHWLLTKMLISKNKAKMYHALNLMLHAENSHQKNKRYKVTSRMYEIFKKNYAVILSERALKNNPMHNPDIKLKHAIATKKRGKTAGMTGRRHTEETKIAMRAKRAVQVITKETKEKLRIINIQKQSDPVVQAQKRKESAMFTGTVGYHNPITGQYKYFKKDIPTGWVKGRIKK